MLITAAMLREEIKDRIAKREIHNHEKMLMRRYIKDKRAKARAKKLMHPEDYCGTTRKMKRVGKISKGVVVGKNKINWENWKKLKDKEKLEHLWNRHVARADKLIPESERSIENSGRMFNLIGRYQRRLHKSNIDHIDDDITQEATQLQGITPDVSNYKRKRSRKHRLLNAEHRKTINRLRWKAKGMYRKMPKTPLLVGGSALGYYGYRKLKDKSRHEDHQGVMPSGFSANMSGTESHEGLGAKVKRFLWRKKQNIKSTPVSNARAVAEWRRRMASQGGHFKLVNDSGEMRKSADDMLRRFKGGKYSRYRNKFQNRKMKSNKESRFGMKSYRRNNPYDMVNKVEYNRLQFNRPEFVDESNATILHPKPTRIAGVLGLADEVRYYEKMKGRRKKILDGRKLGKVHTNRFEHREVNLKKIMKPGSFISYKRLVTEILKPAHMMEPNVRRMVHSVGGRTKLIQALTVGRQRRGQRLLGSRGEWLLSRFNRQSRRLQLNRSGKNLYDIPGYRGVQTRVSRSGPRLYQHWGGRLAGRLGAANKTHPVHYMRTHPYRTAAKIGMIPGAALGYKEYKKRRSNTMKVANSEFSKLNKRFIDLGEVYNSGTIQPSNPVIDSKPHYPNLNTAKDIGFDTKDVGKEIEGKFKGTLTSISRTKDNNSNDGREKVNTTIEITSLDPVISEEE